MGPTQGTRHTQRLWAGNCCLWHSFSAGALSGRGQLFSGWVNLAPCKLFPVQAWGTPRHDAMCWGSPSSGFFIRSVGFYLSLASRFPAHYCPLLRLVSSLRAITLLTYSYTVPRHMAWLQRFCRNYLQISWKISPKCPYPTTPTFRLFPFSLFMLFGAFSSY